MTKKINIRKEWYDIIQQCSNVRLRGIICCAVMEYCFTGHIADMPEKAMRIFLVIKNQIDKSSELSEKRKDAAQKRWGNDLHMQKNPVCICKENPFAYANETKSESQNTDLQSSNKNFAYTNGTRLHMQRKPVCICKSGKNEPKGEDAGVSADKVNSSENEGVSAFDKLMSEIGEENGSESLQKLRERTKENEQEKENFPPHPLYKEKEIDKENKKENTILISPVVNTNNARAIFLPPTISEVKEYCEKRKNGINPEQFVNFYQSKGWMIGKNKMKDWKAAVRTWEIQNRKNNGNNQTSDNSKFRDSKNVYETKSDF